MTVEEIFRDLSSHIIKGVMLHEQMADYYDFLNLHGYKRCHEYHMHCEMKSLRRLHRYFINHFNRLIEENTFDNPDAVPSSWYRYTRQDVDANTKRNAVKSGIEKWVAWEDETKKLYQKMYTELMTIGEVAAAKKVACLVHDVDCELKWAQRKHIDLMTVDYSISYIIGEQNYLHDWYKNKMR
mgnify:FL=1